MKSKNQLIKNYESNVEIAEADVKDKDMLENLFQYYLHDLSEYADTLNVNSQGKFDTNDVAIFFDETNLIPMTIKVEDEIIGFIFLNHSTGMSVDYVINDIFILRKYRNKGIGKVVINKLFKLYTGKYGLLELIKNKPAIKFWHSVFDDENIKYEESQTVSDGEVGLMQKFTIK